MIRYKVLYLLTILVCIILAGCAGVQKYNKIYGSNNLIYASYSMADELESHLKDLISTDEPLLVASFVNINRLDQSSAFGRIVSEQIASRFAQNGYKIIEMKLRDRSVYIKEAKGEFLLSRDLKAISKMHNASVVIVGTYAEGYDTVYVSARMVLTSNSEVVSSSDRAIRMDFASMKALLRDGNESHGSGMELRSGQTSLKMRPPSTGHTGIEIYGINEEQF